MTKNALFTNLSGDAVIIDRHNISRISILDGQYEGLACVGVFTYLTDSIGTLRELSRVVKCGGIMVLTQRSDLFVERNFQSVFEELSSEGLIEKVRNIRKVSLPAG